MLRRREPLGRSLLWPVRRTLIRLRHWLTLNIRLARLNGTHRHNPAMFIRRILRWRILCSRIRPWLLLHPLWRRRRPHRILYPRRSWARIGWTDVVIRCQRSSNGCVLRPPVIDGGKVGAIAPGLLHMLHLCRHRWSMLFMERGNLRWTRSRVNAA